jgi:hypothetical protein
MSGAEKLIIGLLIANLLATLLIRSDVKDVFAWLRLIDERIRPK